MVYQRIDHPIHDLGTCVGLNIDCHAPALPGGIYETDLKVRSAATVFPLRSIESPTKDSIHVLTLFHPVARSTAPSLL